MRNSLALTAHQSGNTEAGAQSGAPMKVAVLDPLVCFRLGLTAALAHAGFEPFEPPDVEDWMRSGDSCAVVIALLTDLDAQRLSNLRACAPRAPELALLSEVTAEAYSWAMRCGATAAVSRDAPPEDIVECLAAACAGRVIMPAPVAQALTTAFAPCDHPALTATEVRWLGRLSEGRTVGELARQHGYSEREMFRRLHRLYDRMGVCGRTEALLAAQRWGLV